ncbi:MAG: glycine/betaine/sarcosine/D-proline family reductase selenoprotein B, partial [Deltaproteobacteria bacterium]|nr:glycine/betaine/sarcosine/D-proline family reductase selenoprotein B [Deltaproteobacteria bacterium]
MERRIRVIHYLNQFFAGVGGEEKAGLPMEIREGALGPGRKLQAELGPEGEIVATLLCGDNAFAEQPEGCLARALELIGPYKPDLLVAGPAFGAGRYGLACGQLCQHVQDHLGIPALTAMHPENPGVELYRARVYIVATGPAATAMEPALRGMARLARKLVTGVPLGSPEVEGYLPRGIRRNEFAAEPAGVRAVHLLLRKLRGDPYESEVPLPSFERVTPAPPLRDLQQAAVALVTEAGVVPRGNPDRLEARRATKWLRYSLHGLRDLTSEQFECVHGGFDGHFVNQDPDRVVPLDVLRELEAEGRIGAVHEILYVTVGAGAPLANARRFGQEIAAEL